MASDLLLVIVISQRLGQRIAADTLGVHAMVFLQVVTDPDVLCDVPVGHMDGAVLLFEPCIESPAHDSHKRGVPEGLAPLNVKLNLPFMELVVTSIAQCNQVVRGVASSFAALNVVDVKDLIPGFAFAVLADMAVPP